MNITKNCGSCRLYQKSACKSPKLTPILPKSMRYLVVGSTPTTTDDDSGKLFSGEAGNLLRKTLKDLGFPLGSVGFTSAVRCKPQKIADESEISLCGEIVVDIIEEFKPEGVICLGDAAVKAVFPNSYTQVYSVSKSRGSLVPLVLKSGSIISVSVTYPPSFFLSDRVDDSMFQVWYDDLLLTLNKIQDLPDLKPRVVLCKTFDLIRECAARLKKEKMVAWDFETTSLKPFGQKGKVSELYSVAFAFENGDSYAIPLFNYFPSNMQNAVNELVREFFYSLNPDQIKIAHNTKFDMGWGLFKLGWGLSREPLGVYEDTSLLCWILDERTGMSRLKVAAWRYLGVKDWSIDVRDVRKLPLDNVLKYNALDSFYTLRLYSYLKAKVFSSESSKDLYLDILRPAMLQFLKIEIRGVPVELKVREDFFNLYNKKLLDLLKEIREDTGRPSLNPGSTKQLQDYFVNECAYSMPKKTKTGYSTDDESLKFLITKYGDPVAKNILEYRGIGKLQSTYIAGMGKHIYDDGKIHGGFNLTSTVTGRTSSSEPNMQNFPKRKNKEVRGIVSAPSGYKLCSFDYGQIEARLFAVVTGDKNYLDDLYKGYDIHMEKAEWVYHKKLGWPIEKARNQRSSIKNGGVFPAFYGAGAFSISGNLGITKSLAEEFKRSIFDRYSSIKGWQRSIADEEAEKGYIESLFGRRRRSPIKYNELLNFTTQSTASDMTLSAMNLLGRRYDIAFMIHDDLSIFLPDDENLTSHIDYICEAMLVIPWLYLSKSSRMKEFAPLQVECEIGTTWSNQKSFKEVDSVQAGFNNLNLCIERASEIKNELLEEGW